MDDALVHAARSGDRDALSALCEALYPSLHSYLARLAGPVRADDLTQEALIRILGRLPDFTLPGARFEDWAMRIAYRLFQEKTPRRAQPPSRGWGFENAFAGPEEAAAAREREEAVHKAVEKLPDELRSMVKMRYELNMCHRDIAQKLGVAESRVKRRLRDALKQLRAEQQERKG